MGLRLKRQLLHISGSVLRCKHTTYYVWATVLKTVKPVKMWSMGSFKCNPSAICRVICKLLKIKLENQMLGGGQGRTLCPVSMIYWYALLCCAKGRHTAQSPCGLRSRSSRSTFATRLMRFYQTATCAVLGALSRRRIIGNHNALSRYLKDFLRWLEVRSNHAGSRQAAHQALFLPGWNPENIQRAHGGFRCLVRGVPNALQAQRTAANSATEDPPEALPSFLFEGACLRFSRDWLSHDCRAKYSTKGQWTPSGFKAYWKTPAKFESRRGRLWSNPISCAWRRRTSQPWKTFAAHVGGICGRARPVPRKNPDLNRPVFLSPRILFFFFDLATSWPAPFVSSHAFDGIQPALDFPAGPRCAWNLPSACMASLQRFTSIDHSLLKSGNSQFASSHQCQNKAMCPPKIPED